MGFNGWKIRHRYLVIHFYCYVRVLSIHTHTQLNLNIIMYGRILNAMLDIDQAFSDIKFIPSQLQQMLSIGRYEILEDGE